MIIFSSPHPHDLPITDVLNLLLLWKPQVRLACCPVGNSETVALKWKCFPTMYSDELYVEF